MHSLDTLRLLNRDGEARIQLRADVALMELFLTGDSEPTDLLYGILDPATRNALGRILGLARRAA